MAQTSIPHLRNLHVFSELNEADFAAVVALARTRSFSSGEVVFEQGDRGDTMLFVLAGRLRVELDDGKGNRTDVGSVAAGQVVGEMAALDPAPRAASVIAASDVTAHELSVDALRQLRREAPAAAAAITAAIIGDVTSRLRGINDRIEQELNPGAPVRHPVAKAGAGRGPSSGFRPTGDLPELGAKTTPESRPWWAKLFGG